MKIHITNLYNFNQNDELVKLQHDYAQAGRELGFYEMGIFSYPVESDSRSELSRRLDGIIASLEQDDIVIMQLPTRNGLEYENMLMGKMRAYPGVKTIILLHSDWFDFVGMDAEKKAFYSDLLKCSDVVLFTNKGDRNALKAAGIENIICASLVKADSTLKKEISGYDKLCKSGFYKKKVLMDAIAAVYESKQEQAVPEVESDEDFIHIGFGLYDKTGNYSVWVGATMQSIIETTNASLCFHIIHDKTLREDNRERLEKVARSAGHKIQFYYLDDSVFAGISVRAGYFTVGTMFRLVLPDYVPELSKILYLDADIVVNRDIKELWDMDIQNYALAAVPDMETFRGMGRPIPVRKGEVDAKEYFNAGVLSMNLDFIRNNGNLCEQSLDYLERTPETMLLDQDALNVLYKGKTLLLDESWNYQVKFVHWNKEYKLEKKLYHYVGTALQLQSTCALDQLCFEIIGRTPWGKEKCHEILEYAMQRTRQRMDLYEGILTKIAASPIKRVFYGQESKAMQNMYKLLPIRENDYRVLAEVIEEPNDILLCKELSALQKETEEFVVFVLPEADNGSSIRRLEEMGLVRDKDFFVIPCILGADKGGYL